MASKLSLADVLPRFERVGIGGDQFIEVYGISGEDIGMILNRWPDAFQQLAKAGGKPGGMAPGLLGAVIAATQRNGKDESLLGDEKVEKRARALSVGAQLKVLQAMGRCTFPDGIGPFLEGLQSMSSAAKEAMAVVVRVVSKDQAMASPPTPKPSAVPETLPSGD
jgi:hypothetical protein